MTNMKQYWENKKKALKQVNELYAKGVSRNKIQFIIEDTYGISRRAILDRLDLLEEMADEGEQNGS